MSTGTGPNDKRPGEPTAAVSTPLSWTMIQLLGSGPMWDGVTVTKTQYQHLRKAYEFDNKVTDAQVEDLRASREVQATRHAEKMEEWDARPYPASYEKPPLAPEPFDEQASRNFLTAGEDINLGCHMKRDGMRIIAYLSKWLEPGQDPMKLIVMMASDARFDVDFEDTEWADADPVEEEEDDPMLEAIPEAL